MSPAVAAPHNGTATSRKAAQMILPFANTQRRRVLEYLRLHHRSGATREEIEDALGMPHQSVGPRVRELLDAHLIREPGTLAKTKAGRPAKILYPAKP